MRLIPLRGKRIHYSSEPDKGTYTLEKEIVLLDADTNIVYAIPVGFSCDGASLPWFLPETGACEAGGFVHDFVYRFGFIFLWDGSSSRWIRQQLDRKRADQLYGETCRAYGSYALWSETQRLFLRIWPGTLWIWRKRRNTGAVWTGALPTTLDYVETQ